MRSRRDFRRSVMSWLMSTSGPDSARNVARPHRRAPSGDPSGTHQENPVEKGPTVQARQAVDPAQHTVAWRFRFAAGEQDADSRAHALPPRPGDPPSRSPSILRTPLGVAGAARMPPEGTGADDTGTELDIIEAIHHASAEGAGLIHTSHSFATARLGEVAGDLSVVRASLRSTRLLRL